MISDNKVIKNMKTAKNGIMNKFRSAPKLKKVRSIFATRNTGISPNE
jgi:hypothetical protein